MADHTWIPQSPDLPSFKPDPDSNTSWAPQSPDFGAHDSYNNGYSNPPTFALDNPSWDSKPATFGASAYPGAPYQSFPPHPADHQSFYPPDMPATTRSRYVKKEDPDWTPETNDTKPFADSSIPQYPPDVKQPATQKMDTRGIEVKTKFPTARIKRIMQADEDVGKVAQVTPVVMAKALELFMIRLITASSDIAKSKGSKRVQTTHMKQAVMADEQFDNLREIVAKVPDAPAKKSAAKDSDSDDDDAPKKRKKGAAGPGAKKKRRGSDDDF